MKTTWLKIAIIWLLAGLPTAYLFAYLRPVQHLGTLDGWLLYYPLALMLNLIGGVGGYAVGTAYVYGDGEKLSSLEVMRRWTVGVAACGVLSALLLMARGSNF